MTKSPPGPSLSQAHDSSHDNHAHFHLHDRRRPSSSSPGDDQHHHKSHHGHQHVHLHQQHQRQAIQVVPNAPGTPNSQSDLVTRIVQTVSVIQIVDGAGAPLEIQTHYAQPATVLVDTVAGITVALTDAVTAAALPSPDPISSAVPDPAPTPELVPVPEAESTPAPILESLSNELEQSSGVSAVMSSAASATSQDDDVVTSSSSSSSLSSTAPPVPPAPSPSPFPTYIGSVNSTSPSAFIPSGANSTASYRDFADASLSSSAGDSSTVYSSFSDPSSTSLLTSTLSSYLGSSTTGTVTPSSSLGGGAGFGGNGISKSSPSATGTSGETDNGEGEVDTGTVVGSVVGSVAGLALLAVLVLMALRWKKRQNGQVALGNEVDRQRGMLTGGDGGSPPSHNGGMVQRSIAFSSAALAGLSPKRSSRNPSTPPTTTGEQGFYRVSGKKLPPVLQVGGDGFTDPRESPHGHQNRGSGMSDESVFYRDSQIFPDDTNAGMGTGRLTLGSPMRPVSGVPIIRTGPARTAVTESNPFIDPVSPLDPPPPRDPIGRSLRSLDGSGGSRGSVSRFTENID